MAIFEDLGGLENDMSDSQQYDGLALPDAVCLETMVMEIPEVGSVVTAFDPVETARDMDDIQGDNYLNAQGDCGVVSVANLCVMAGKNLSEDEVLAQAVQMGLCSYSPSQSPDMNGGTTAFTRSLLLHSYGIPNEVRLDIHSDASIEAIARYTEAGHGVNLSLNAGLAWNDVSSIGDGSANHSLIATDTARDPKTGELKGLFVCDSGLTDRDSKAMFLSVDTLRSAYENAPNSGLVVTTHPIRA